MSKEIITSPESEFSPLGNMTSEDLARLRPDWEDQAIEVRTGTPQETEAHTSEELGRMGLVGVELKKPE